MAEKDLGKVRSAKGQSFQVKWNDKGGQVYVKPMATFWGTWTKCDAKARTAGDAMDIASAFVRHRS